MSSGRGNPGRKVREDLPESGFYNIGLSSQCCWECLVKAFGFLSRETAARYHILGASVTDCPQFWRLEV